MNAPYELLLAFRYLRVHRGRTFLSVITMISVGGVAVGTAALVIALALMTGFEEDMKLRILRGSAHLQMALRPTLEQIEVSAIVGKLNVDRRAELFLEGLQDVMNAAHKRRL